ncbi:hypothetical protein N7501_000636 [Penicillium viridicatum]|nr:hypothetical protein N7501_000636 [Penicillium viridicatum]
MRKAKPCAWLNIRMSMPDIDANEIYGKELDKLQVWAKVEWKDNMLVAPPFFVKLTEECAYLITSTCQISA